MASIELVHGFLNEVLSLVSNSKYKLFIGSIDENLQNVGVIVPINSSGYSNQYIDGSYSYLEQNYMLNIQGSRDTYSYKELYGVIEDFIKELETSKFNYTYDKTGEQLNIVKTECLGGFNSIGYNKFNCPVFSIRLKIFYN